MPRIRDLFRNPGWKLLAVVFAYLFWLAVIEERQAIRQLDVPVRFEHLASTLALLREGPSTVVFRVQGAEQLIKALETPDLEASVDLAGLGVGTHIVRLNPDSPRVVVKKPGLTVTEVYPSAIEVRLEPKASALVPVRITTVGSPAPGYVVADQRVDPPRVRIEGPQSAVKLITEIHTREVSLGGRQASVEQMAWVDVPNPGVAIVGEDQVKVTVDVREAFTERSFAALPVAPVGTVYETRLTPKLVRVTVRGPEALLAQISRDDLVVWVDLSGRSPQPVDYRLAVACTFNRDQLRDKVRVIAIADPELSVHVYNRKLEAPAPVPDGNPRGG